MLVGQVDVPGLAQAIDSAKSRGWEAVFLVVVMGCMCGFFVWVIRRQMAESSAREDRLANRVSQLEDVIRTELMSALKANSEMMGKVLAAAEAMIRASDRMCSTLERFTSILDVRPCLLPNAEQRKLLKDFEDADK